MAKLEMQGLSELRGRLRALPDKMVKRILRGALRQAANLVKNEAKARVPTDTGALKASIRIVARRGSPTRVVFNVVAGALTDKQKSKFGQKTAFYALFVEKGSAHAPAHPFMRPAIESKAQAAIDVLVSEVGKRLPEVVS